MTYDIPRLLGMTQAQLDALFAEGAPGPIPDGASEGTALIAPGTRYADDIAEFVRRFAWKGKIFDAANGRLRNRLVPFGLEAIVATIEVAPSWLDRKPCIVLDYSRTSLVARWVRDEIRLIEPGLYLGKAYLLRARILDFALRF